MHSKTIAIDARLVGTQSTGDATYWRGLLHGLAQLETDCRFLLCSNAPKPDLVPDSSRFEWLQIPSSTNRWWSLIKFPIIARRHGANVIHTQYNLSPLVGKSGITTIHDVSFLIEPSWFQPRDLLLLSRFVHPSARRAARVITVSETSKSDISKFYPDVAEKIRVTPLACGLGIVELDPPSALKIVNDELGIDASYCLTVGTRWPRKNMQLAIDAMNMLPDSTPHRLVVTGKPGWGDERLNDRVIAPGYVTDLQLSALYTCADIYLAPSRYEGFGLTLLEAFQCGAPVICSSGGSLPEVAGNAAHVMPDWFPETWSKAINDLLMDSSKLDELRQKGKKRASEFSWNTMAARTLKVYEEVLNDRS